MDQYDVIIIGTGAGGGTLAHRLASTGKKILILERGDFLPKEVENWNPREVYTNGRYRPAEKWYDKDGQAFAPFTHYWVGGNTKMYGAALLRLRQSDFGAVRHYDGISPAWPLTYDEFEPYYARAEQLYSVHGQRGLDPTEPPASAPYPFPALPHEPRIQELVDDLRGIGLRPAPIALGVRLPQDNGRQESAQVLSLFDGYPDPTEAKADAHVVGIRYAQQHPNVTLRTGMRVLQLLTDAGGRRVTEVVAEHEGRELRFRGDIVAVCCGAINSAALLLRSANERHPDGLANSSGMVGRHLMLHNNGTLVALSKKPNDSIFQKSFMLTDYYHGAPDSPFPLGAVQLMGKTDPDTLRGEVAEFMPGADIDVEDVARHSVDFFLTAEDLPRFDNRVAVRPDGSIQLMYRANNVEAYQRLRQKLIDALEAVGYRYAYCKNTAYVGFKLGISGVSHQSGTCRFGADPRSSVLDLNCRAHDLDNLYVVDTSFFPASGAVNPSLTAMANALRVGDHLAGRLS